MSHHYKESSSTDSPFVDPDNETSAGLLSSPDSADHATPQTEQVETTLIDTKQPRAPYLRPSVPGLSSTVSSLSGSRGLSPGLSNINTVVQSSPNLLKNNDSSSSSSNRTNRDMSHLHNHTLMQMLNMVGNRFLEAEGNGMLPLQEGHTPMSQSMYEQPSVSAVVDSRKRMFGSVVVDDTTPRGGRSPLTSSVSNVGATGSRTPATYRLSSLSAESPEHSLSGSGPSLADETPPAPSVVSSTDSSLSDISNTGMQVSIHALSTTAATEATPDRREQLTTRVRSIFGLNDEEKILSCHPCWLFRGILLQGYVYVLSSHVCFYAYLPSREDRVLWAGALRKKTRRTHRFSRHWAVLRGRALSWYESDKDPYFPQDHIDLRNVSGVEALEDSRFSVETAYRTFLFEADSPSNTLEWVNHLKKAVFRAQNEGESVRISIPFEAILDVDGSDASSFGSADWAGEGQDIVSIKVINAAQSRTDFSMDEYFFLNLASPSGFVQELQDKLIECARAAQVASRSKPIVRDSTSSLAATATKSAMGSEPISIPSKGRKANVTAVSGLESQLAEATLSSTPTGNTSRLQQERQDEEQAALSSSLKTIRSMSSSIHSYPPSPSRAPSLSSSSWEQRKRAIPQWVKGASSRLNLSSSETWLAFVNRAPGRAVKESWSAPPLTEGRAEKSKEHMDDSSSSLFSVLEAPEAEADVLEADVVQQFRECFSLPDSEKLLGHLSASLYRVLPVTGRIYVSTHYVCFRSSRLASKTMGRTLMILPKREIISTSKNTSFRYGQHGLVVIVRGHEELFLEFSSEQRRDQCASLINLAMEKDNAEEVEDPHKHEALLLTDLGKHLQTSDKASESSLSEASLFHSSSTASFAAKPRESLHITFLTIGSRGDVQPYIAFAKGLKQEGHRVRIATHKEFQVWIESYDIEFREVGGDPAELMKICIENGTFTMAFLRESMTKFRGWLDDLLVSCWNACQGTEVIIESPSAIAGIHIAEALQVPYYRSFTMPWTRTRVYPHAFAVPGHKAGGNYNYMSYVIFDQVFWRASAGQINTWRRRCLSLKPTSLEKLEPHKVPFLYNFSPNLVPKPIDWYDWIHVTGFWFLDHADESGRKSWEPPADLVAFIARAKATNRKLVYIGWGSIVVADAEAMTNTVVEAVKKSGVCAVLSKGWSDRLQTENSSAKAQDEDLHPDIFTVQSIPHDWLFPQLDAACHHGGSGTLGASLRAGVPTIAKPYFGDQFFWASQVESLNIGSFVRTFTVDAFADALITCTTDTRILENARKMGEVIRAENGVANGIRAFYSDWDYACGLIPRDGKLTTDRKQELQEVEANPAAAPEKVSKWFGNTTDEAKAVQTGSDEDNNNNHEDNDDDDDDDDGLDGWSVVSGSEE